MIEKARDMSESMNIAIPALVWREIFRGEVTETGWQHSGIDLLKDGRLIYAAPNGSDLVIDDLTNGVRNFVATPAHEMHDVVSAENGIWLCDIGHKFVLSGHEYIGKLTPAKILRIDLAGNVLQEVKQPDLPIYKEKSWSPTGVSIAPDGDIWVADGYSSYLVLHFDASGNLLDYFDGARSGLTFNCPHTLRVLRSDDSYEVVIADRANKRLVWMTPAGNVTRIADHAALTSPSGITRYGAGLLVTQLHGSLVYLGDNGQVDIVLAGPDIHTQDGWPNARNADGTPIAPEVSTSSLIAPHGITSNNNGDVYLTQWLIGGHVLGGVHVN